MRCQKLKTYMETGRVIFLPVGAIRANPAQPRQSFPPEGLDELADSIRRHGILQPLTVRRREDGYELVSGERRLRAAVLAGVGDVPCLVLAMDDRESRAAALVENLQRQDLDFLEQARGIQALLEQGLTQEQAARLLGKSQSAVANKLRLLRHEESVLAAARAAGLGERHVRALLRLEGEERKLSAIREIARQQMSAAHTEKYVESLLRQGERRRTASVEGVISALSTAVRRLQTAGITAIAEQRETESQIILTVTISKG